MTIKVEKQARHITKGQLGYGTKATRYQDATFAWASKKFKKDELRIKVLVWSLKTDHIDLGLTQVFTSDDLKGARWYAKKLIEDGASKFLYIQMEVFGFVDTKQDWHILETERYELEP